MPENFNGTSVERGYGTVMSLFEEKALSYGENIGLINERKNLNYQEVNEQSNRLAHYLIGKLSVSRGELVGVILERDMHLIPALYGILKSGAAYVPIDPTYPVERIATMLNEAGVNKVVSLTRLFGGLTGKEVIYLDREQEAIEGYSSENPEVSVSPDDTAYVLFTSGSTGKPKGVEVSHSSLYNIILHLQEVYPLEESDCYLLKTNYSFDVSVAELYGWYHAGGKLGLLANGAEADPQLLLEAIDRYQVTHVNFVPYIFSRFTDELNNSIFSTSNMLSRVKYIFLAGEELPASLVKRFYAINKNVQLENIYGPTEGTIYSCSYSVDRNIKYDKVPIGKPLSNICLYILDKYLDPVSLGDSGELFISGTNLAKGYLNQPKLTEEKFIDHPFKNGERLYKTGDLAKLDESGNITFLGRIDDEVKIRGIRINLEEIKCILLEMPEIKEAVVVVKQDEEDESYISAYVTGKQANGGLIRNAMYERVPSYMVPASIQVVNQFPLLSNGKVDKKSLPDFEKADKEVCQATNETEGILVMYASQAFKLSEDQISVMDSILDYGRHSIKLMVFLNLIEKHFTVNLPIQVLFQKQTFQKLADYLIITTSTPTLPNNEGEELIEISI